MVIQPKQCSHIPINGHCQKGYHCKPYSDNCFLCKTVQEKCDKGKVLVGEHKPGTPRHRKDLF